MREWLRQDVRFAVRGIRRAPGFAVLVVTTLALGIGANAALFALVDRLFLRPPSGVERPAQLRRLHVESRESLDGTVITRSRLDYPEFATLDSALAPYAVGSVYTPPETLSFGNGDHAPMMRASFTATNYFTLLGVRPMLGRFFVAEENRMGDGTPVAVLNEAFWREHLAGDPAAIGRAIVVDGRPFTVVGVAAPGFAGTDLDAVDVWLPLALYPARPIGDRPWYVAWRSCWCLEAIVRVRSETADATLAARGTTVLRRGPPGAPKFLRDSTAALVLGPILQALGPVAKPDVNVAISLRLTGVVALVLLIACANVANLLLVRGVRRQHEIAIRLALGGSHTRLVRLLFTESMLLTVIAGVAAVVLAVWLAGALRALLFPATHFSGALIDLRVVGFTSLIALGTGIAAGLSPSLHASRRDGTLGLKSGSVGVGWRSRMRPILLATQTAICVLLLIGAGVLVKSLGAVRGIDVGYDVDRLIYGTVIFKNSRQHYVELFGHESEVAAGMADVAEQLRVLPDVERVALARSGPMAGFSDTRLYLPGRDSVPRLGGLRPLMVQASPEYFATVGLRLQRGRLYAPTYRTDSSHHAPPEMVVNESMARTLWPGADALGKCMIIFAPGESCTVVVGIVADAHLSSIVESPTMIFYTAVARPSTLVVRAAPERVGGVAQQVSRALRARFPGAEPPRVFAMADRLRPQLRPWRLGAAMFTGFGVLALMLAAIGIYSVTAFAVSQRTQEIGLRIALGARGADVMRLVLREGMRPVAVGIVVGLGASLFMGRAIASLAYGTTARDPAITVAVALFLVAVAALASLIPGLRATRVDPLVAIRTE